MAIIGLRKILGGAVALAFILFLVWAFWPRPLAVTLAQIDRGPMRLAIMDEGQTQVKDVYRVSAPVAGRVLRVEVDVGDLVGADETIIASLLPSAPSFLDARALREAEATVRAAEATVQRPAGVSHDPAPIRLRRNIRCAEPAPFPFPLPGQGPSCRLSMGQRRGEPINDVYEPSRPQSPSVAPRSSAIAYAAVSTASLVSEPVSQRSW